MKLINVSGEPREYESEGFIYEFPFPSEKPTEVPKEVAEKLLVTKMFVEAGQSQKAKKKDDKLIEIEDDDNKKIENGTI